MTSMIPRLLSRALEKLQRQLAVRRFCIDVTLVVLELKADIQITQRRRCNQNIGLLTSQESRGSIEVKWISGILLQRQNCLGQAYCA